MSLETPYIGVQPMFMSRSLQEGFLVVDLKILSERIME